jgi:glyoxylase-like metal-dependent hydrolase (beta-lactamase superfamily II)
VGDAQAGFICIDPGPADTEHLQKLLDAAGGDIRSIVCTHSHPDHSPGAKPLQAMCRNKPPILGLASAPTARAASEFTPDRAIGHGERLVLGAGEHTHTLLALHTPGHAANHVCLVLVEDGLLFSGDHILNGSTTVVDPPDGDMNDYLESLDLLAAACDEHGIAFIAPAHGYVLGDALGAIAKLKAHRLQREAKILKVMQALPNGSMDDWVKLAYDDVDPRIWPVAKRSLLAHVDRIRSLGGFNL